MRVKAVINERVERRKCDKQKHWRGRVLRTASMRGAAALFS